MNSNRQKPAVSTPAKVTPQPVMPAVDTPDERYPGSYFRVPGVPMPGKTTWSLTK
jgi:hypothetical protein